MGAGRALLSERTAGVEGDYVNSLMTAYIKRNCYTLIDDYLHKEELLHIKCTLGATTAFLESYTKSNFSTPLVCLQLWYSGQMSNRGLSES